MTEPKTHTSLFAQARRRSEFIALYDGTYAAVVAELLALTGDADLAHAVAGASYMRAWQVWPAVRKQARPVMWVRADVVRRIRRRPLTQRMLKQQMPSTPQVHLDDEDSVLLARLRWLTIGQRLPVVLHYMADVPSCFAVFVDQVPAAAQAARTVRVSCGVACSGHEL